MFQDFTVFCYMKCGICWMILVLFLFFNNALENVNIIVADVFRKLYSRSYQHWLRFAEIYNKNVLPCLTILLGHSIWIFTKHDFQVSQRSVETLFGMLCTKVYQNQMWQTHYFLCCGMAEAELAFSWTWCNDSSCNVVNFFSIDSLIWNIHLTR